jgi:hypothetical protein
MELSQEAICLFQVKWSFTNMTHVDIKRGPGIQRKIFNFTNHLLFHTKVMEVGLHKAKLFKTIKRVDDGFCPPQFTHSSMSYLEEMSSPSISTVNIEEK